MKCTECDTEINQSFTYAIKCNVCPACGKEIMDKKRMDLYQDLKSCLQHIEFTMDGRDENIERVVNCIMTNYSFDSGSFKTPAHAAPRPIKTHSPGESEIYVDDLPISPEESGMDPEFYESMPDVEFSQHDDEVDRIKEVYRERKSQLMAIDAKVKRSS